METRILNETFEEFLNEFYDERVKTFLRQNLFFAGGCIRSLVLNETPKDYDLFFRTEEAKDLFISWLEFNHNAISSPFTNMKKLLLARMSQTKNAATFHLTKNNKVDKVIQCVSLFSGSPKEVIGNFDFTVNMNYYDPLTNELVICDLPSIKNKKLIVNSIRNIGYYRVKQFERYGFTIDPNVKEKLIRTGGIRGS